MALTLLQVVRIIGNNRTKPVYIGQRAVVKRAVGLGGWHWLVRISRAAQGLDLCLAVDATPRGRAPARPNGRIRPGVPFSRRAP